MATQGRDASAAAMRSVVDRFNVLIQEHDLSFAAAAEALGDLGITLADLSSVESLQVKLTSPVMRELATRFHIEYDWLAGKSSEILSPKIGSWYKSQIGAAHQLRAAGKRQSRPELSICLKGDADLEMLDDNGPDSRLPHFLPVLIESTPLPGGEALETYEVWEEGRWSYWRSREHLKQVVHFATALGVWVTGRRIPNAEYDAIVEGRALPSPILRRHARVAWHPEDYVRPTSAAAKQVEEWRRILEDSDYKSTFAEFDKILATR